MLRAKWREGIFLSVFLWCERFSLVELSESSLSNSHYALAPKFCPVWRSPSLLLFLGSFALLLPCGCRYGKDWDKYCSIVKNRIIPYVY